MGPTVNVPSHTVFVSRTAVMATVMQFPAIPKNVNNTHEQLHDSNSTFGMDLSISNHAHRHRHRYSLPQRRPQL